MSHYSDAVKCSGTRADGGPCRALTRSTVEVAGTAHAACQHHGAQVEAREYDLAARKAAQPAEQPAKLRDVRGADAGAFA